MPADGTGSPQPPNEPRLETGERSALVEEADDLGLTVHGALCLAAADLPCCNGCGCEDYDYCAQDECRDAMPKLLTLTRRATKAEARAIEREKLVRDCFTYLPHRVASHGERYGLLAAKLDEEVAEVKDAAIGSPEFVGELGDLVEVCYALGGEKAVEAARLAKKAERGGFDKLLVMRLADRTDYPPTSTTSGFAAVQAPSSDV